MQDDDIHVRCLCEPHAESGPRLVALRLPMRSTHGDEICCTDGQAAEAVYPRPRSNEALISKTVAEHG